LSQLVRYFLFGRGMLASNGVEGFAFTQIHPGPVAAPDLELIFLPLEFRQQFFEAPREHAFSLGPAVVAPRSRGHVGLRGPDPLLAPIIDPALLTDPDGVDAAVLWAGLRLSRKIAATSPLAEQTLEELRPGPDVQTEEEFLVYAGQELQTVYHPTSTCRMGSDPRSVVDPRLQVRGVDGLWIADASVMPTVPRGHPNAVVAMIANRAANFLAESRV
jgi:choline dehydrogenase